MKTSILLLVLCIVVIILLCYPEDTHAVVFVLSRGKIRGLSNIKRSTTIKRKKQRLKRLKRRKKNHKSSQKYRDIRRWLKRFKHKVHYYILYLNSFSHSDCVSHVFINFCAFFMYLMKKSVKFNTVQHVIRELQSSVNDV